MHLLGKCEKLVNLQCSSIHVFSHSIVTITRSGDVDLVLVPEVPTVLEVSPLYKYNETTVGKLLFHFSGR